VARVTWSLNFWALNANNSKTVNATDFKFGVHVSRDSQDMTPYFFRKEGVCKNSLGGDMHSHECLLVYRVSKQQCTDAGFHDGDSNFHLPGPAEPGR